MTHITNEIALALNLVAEGHERVAAKILRDLSRWIERTQGVPVSFGVTPFAEAYPAPWRLGDREVVDRDGCNVQDFDDDPDVIEFWLGIVEAVNRAHVGENCFPFAEEVCPGHVASAADAKVCGRCGIHINSLYDLDDPINLQGSGPVPIEPRGAP